jgi:hypothetical protein
VEFSSFHKLPDVKLEIAMKIVKNCRSFVETFIMPITLSSPADYTWSIGFPTQLFPVAGLTCNFKCGERLAVSGCGIGIQGLGFGDSGSC